MGDSREPAFDRDWKYLYFITSTNAGATSDGLDMTSDLYQVTSNIYALTLAADTASPIAPEMEDEKAPGEEKAEGKKGEDKGGDAKESSGDEKAHAKPAPKPVKVDLDGIEKRIVALPLPAGVYESVTGGLKGSIYFTERPESGRFGDRGATLSRWTPEERKTEKLAEHVEKFELSANGEKMLLALGHPRPDGSEPPPGGGPKPTWVIVPANALVKAGEGALSFADVKMRVEPHAEWAQMYHEVWRIERAFFYD